MPVGPVNAVDNLTRYVYERSSYRPSDSTVKPKAFYPNAQGQCSVIVTREMDRATIEAYAAEHVTPHIRKPLVGYAKLPAAAAWNQGLDVYYFEPPPDHANIQNYAAAREKMMEQAQELARASTFQLV